VSPTRSSVRRSPGRRRVKRRASMRALSAITLVASETSRTACGESSWRAAIRVRAQARCRCEPRPAVRAGVRSTSQNLRRLRTVSGVTDERSHGRRRLKISGDGQDDAPQALPIRAVRTPARRRLSRSVSPNAAQASVRASLLRSTIAPSFALPRTRQTNASREDRRPPSSDGRHGSRTKSHRRGSSEPSVSRTPAGDDAAPPRPATPTAGEKAPGTQSPPPSVSASSPNAAPSLEQIHGTSSSPNLARDAPLATASKARYHL